MKASWRKDTSLDLDNSTKIQLDSDKLVELINNLRSKSNVSLLTRNTLLDQSTVARGTEILRTGEEIYKELNLKQIDDEDKLIEIMIKHPILIERPIIIKGNIAVIARPIENLEELLK